MLKRFSLTLVASALVLAAAASSPASARGFGGGFHAASFGHAVAARPQSFTRSGGFRHASFAIARGYPCYLCGHTPPHRPILPPGTSNPNSGNSESCHYLRSNNPNMYPPSTICYAQ